ncbi:MAG: hypothetical protein AAF081_00185 [Actinomycetota bacterium]
MAAPTLERVATDRTLAATVAVHAAATMAMVGLIWTVQVVHYPLFENVGADAYPAYQSRHIDRIGALLVVPWGLEGLSIVALVVLAKDRTMRTLAIAGAALMGLILVVTMIWAAPVHGELLDGFDPEQHDTLMTSNLVRTLLWTARGGVAMAMVWVLLDRRAEVT